MVGSSPRSRFDPPRVDDRHILRPRLLAELQQRWRCRAVTLVAGAGAGKTSVLAQAIAENRLRPIGDDRWLSLGSPHDSAAFLAEEVWATLQLAGHPPHDVAGLVEALYGLRGLTALHLDDLHRLDPDGEGMAALASLLRDAPPNLRFVLASRIEPALPFARLEAASELVRIEAAEFSFTPDEQEELAARWGTAADALTEVGGWPALTALQLGAGTEGPVRFLLEEIVHGLDVAARDELAVLVAMGRARPEEMAAALGRPSRLAELAHTVPLIQTTSDGTVVAHDLWTEVGSEVGSSLDPDEIRVRAAQALLGLESVDRAFELLVESDDPSRVVEVVVQTCASGTLDPRPEMIRRWREHLPQSLVGHPVGALLEGMEGVVGDDLGPGVRDALLRSVDEANRAELEELELVAVAMAIWVCMMRAESASVIPLVMRMAEFAAAGNELARPAVSLAQAAMAQVADDDEGALAALDRIEPGAMAARWMAVVEGFRLQSQVMLGRLDDALATAHRFVEISPTGEQGAVAMASFLRGADRDLVELMHRVSENELSIFTNHTVRCFLAVVGAWVGDVDFARKQLDRARDALGGAEPPEMLAVVAQTEAAIALAEGRVDEAADALRSLTERTDAVAWRIVRRAAGLSYMLLPEWRERLDGDELPAVRAVTRDQARNLLRLRAGDGVDAADWAEPSMVLTSLPMRWSAEVAVRRWASGDEAAVSLAEHLASTGGDAAWSIIRELAGGSHADAELADAAARFLAAIPEPTDDPVTIGLIGPVEILARSAPVDSPELRRRRVRQLLALLGLRRSLDRAQVAEILWPEQDAKASAANLRANLRHLLTALEPDRQPGEASYLVRASSTRIELAGPAYVQTDIDLVDRALAEAAELEAAGIHSEAMARYEYVVDRWRGRPLEDLADVSDVVPEAERLTARLVEATVRAAELRLAHGDSDRAADLAARAVAADPWSESARRVGIDAALQDGRLALAKAQAEQCREMLRELGVEPSAETAMTLRRIAGRG